MIIRTLLLCFLFAQVSTETFAQIHASSFASKVDFAVGTTNPGRVVSADFDLDGKTDVAVTNTSGSGISVFRNTGTSGQIDNSLLGTQQIVSVSSSVIEIRAEDLDNDGKADLIVATYGTTNIHVLRNTSTTGNISFAASQNLIAGSDPSTLDINDFDGDGKKEIAAGNFGSNTFSVFRNTSSSGTISFAAKQDFTTSSVSANQTREMISDDFDGDGKKDLAVLYYNGYVSVFRNTSALGTVSFAGSVNLTAMSLNAGICAGDIDGDGKSEIVVSYNNGSSAMLFKNNSSTGTLAFSSFVTITTGSQPYYNTLTDLDGDGKSELVIINRGSNTISIFKNMATVGTVNASSFATKVDFTTGNNPLGFVLSDLNDDGKRELIIANNGSNSISILKNQVVVGLIAHYPLDGNGNDLGAYTLNGTLLSGATAATSRYLSSNASLQFDGTSNARMLTATSPAFSISAMKGLSVSLWIKPDNVVPSPANRIIYLFNDGTRTSELFFNYSAKKLIVSNWNGSSSPYFITPTKVFSANTWYHVVVTIESLSSASQQLSLYVNDTLQFTQAVTMSKPGASSFQLSKHHVNDWNFSGGIDDVRIYNTALSATEVHNLYIIDMPKKTYYSKSTGNLNQLSTWGTNTDGSGTAPLSFDSSNVTYQVKNNTNPVTGGSFKISGANSTLILGDGTNAFNLSIGSNDTLSCDSVYLNNNITLTVQGSFGTAKLNAAPSSAVQYVSTSAQNMASGFYGTLVVSSSTKTLSGNTVVRATLGMLNSIHTNGFNLTLGTDAANRGTLNRTQGTINGKFTRWFTNAVNTSAAGLFPVGTATKYAPFQVEFTSAPTAGGTATVEFIPVNPGITGLPVFDISNGFIFIDKTAIDGYWKTTSTISSGTFTTTCTANAFAGVNAYADLRMLKRAAGGSWTIPGTALTNTGSNSSVVLGRSGLTGFEAEYGIGGDQTQNPLPVKLISFSAKMIDNSTAILKWQTASEVNADQFIVQRSTDKKNWENKNIVAATGNSSVPVSYTTTDEVSTIKGKLYYRLIQFDLNGDSYTSKVVQLDLDNNIKPTINIYPNPTTTQLYVEGLNQGASVYNVLGTRLLEIKDNNTIIDVSAFPKGIYFIKSGNEIKRFIKE